MFLLVQLASGQVKQDIANYIAKYKNIAIEEMVRCKIPASITLAQGLHESGYGKSKLTLEANNHFGIKCKDEWDGKKFYQDDDAPNECFRVYDQAEDSYADHSDFLVTRTRYAGLFALPITDYKAWAKGLKAAGYATNPKYADILIKTIEDYNLTQYDQIGIAMMDERQKLMYGNQADYNANAAPVKTAPQPVASIKTTPTHVVTKKNNASLALVSPPVATPTPQVPQAGTSAKPFIINGTKAIKAQGNTDPLSIAFNYEIDYAQILSYNDMGEGEKFKDGENIFLQPKKNRASETTYTVTAGESMHDIAQKFGVKLHELYAKNLMQPNDQPYAGEIIYLQEKRARAPRTMAYSDFLKTLNSATTRNANVYSGQHTEYIVEPSDTLYSIAKRFNISVQQLAAINNLQTADLHPGQTLVIQ